MAMKPYIYMLALLTSVAANSGWSASTRKAPHIGYVFPAGGQQGTTFSIMAGGQILRGANAVYVSGSGVQASIIQYYKPFRKLMKEHRKELLRQLLTLKKLRLAELPSKNRPSYLEFPGERKSRRGNSKQRTKLQKKDRKSLRNPKNIFEDNPSSLKTIVLPRHPLLEHLEKKSLRELYHLVDTFLNFKELKKKQLNRQLMEMVLIKVTISPNAKPGNRELRVKTPLGLTHPICFQVGTLPERCELEPNDSRMPNSLPHAPPLTLPVLINGQIMPGDVDRFRFYAKRGQELVISTHARQLIPFLADAVPGWFQATLTLYNANGKEVSFSDDYLFHPDPILFFHVPEDGVYALEIRDAIYRGREDFVYRVSIGELPFIEHIFPLGAQVNASKMTIIQGKNLRNTRLRLNTASTSDCIRSVSLPQGKRTSNAVLYALNSLPNCVEIEPNNDPKNAQPITLPQIINGRIEHKNDVDVFAINGQRGDEIVAEVTARRLNSPLDSLVRISDATGTILAWNDDNIKKEGHLHRDMGTLTHHSDSTVQFKLPADGTYLISIRDAQGHGSGAHAYRLRISHPRPDFTLHITPSSITIPRSGVVELTAHALRKDGFQGDITIRLKEASDKFTLSGARIPFGLNQIRMTLSATGKPLKEIIELKLEGYAHIHPIQKEPSLEIKPVIRMAIPADNDMQAFLWRHIVPAKHLLVAFSRGGIRNPISIENTPLRLPINGWSDVTIKGPKESPNRKIQITLLDPPKGISLSNIHFVTEGVTFRVHLKGNHLKLGHTDNLIAQAAMEYQIKNKKNNNDPNRTRHHVIGVLPAIPFVIVPPTKRRP